MFIEEELKQIKALEKSVFSKIENSEEFKEITDDGDYIKSMVSNQYPIIKVEVSNPKVIDSKWLLIDFKRRNE